MMERWQHAAQALHTIGSESESDSENDGFKEKEEASAEGYDRNRAKPSMATDAGLKQESHREKGRDNSVNSESLIIKMRFLNI